MSEQYVKCALPSCLVRVLVSYTDPNRPCPVNEETTLRKNLIDAASESDASVFRHFCSQTHCVEGKEEGEVTMKEHNEYKLEIDRKAKELLRKQYECTADINRFDSQLEVCQQKIEELEEALKHERENHQLKLSELKTNVYKSKKTLKEMAEMMKRETTKLERLFRKKELENERESDEQDRLKTLYLKCKTSRRMVYTEEREVFFREKYGEKSKEVLNEQNSIEFFQTHLQSYEVELQEIEERQLARNKELDAINAVLDGNSDNDTTVASLQEDSAFKSVGGAEKIATVAGTNTAATAATTMTAGATGNVG